MAVMRAFHIARTGLQLQEMNVAVKSQNLASQGVDGYKKQFLVAQDLPYQDIASNPDSPAGLQVGLGVKPAGIYRIFSAGDFIKTDAALDMAIAGDGFFRVTMPDGTIGYTRAGAFEKTPEGRIVTLVGGYELTPGITIPANAEGISISELGEVFAKVPGQTTPQSLGQMQIATFVNPVGLRAIGENLFVETDASGTPTVGNPGVDKRGKIKQGFRESSNVDSVEEITELIQIQRIYEMLTKVINTGDKMWEAANAMGR